MRGHAYSLFETVAWPAAVWCAAEVVLRVMAREPADVEAAAVTGVMAALTIVGCRWRRGTLDRA